MEKDEVTGYWVIELLTADGEHVGMTKIPPFIIPPEVVIWGIRVFQKDDAMHTYKECFAVAITNPVTE